MRYPIIQSQRLNLSAKLIRKNPSQVLSQFVRASEIAISLFVAASFKCVGRILIESDEIGGSAFIETIKVSSEAASAHEVPRNMAWLGLVSRLSDCFLFK